MFRYALSAAIYLTATGAHAQCTGASSYISTSGTFAEAARTTGADLNCIQSIIRNDFLPRSGGAISGPLLSTTLGKSMPTGNNIPTLDFLGNTINFQRQIISGSPSYAGTRVFLDNYSNGYTALPWGGYPNIPAFHAIATAHKGSNGTVSAVYADLRSQGNNPFTSQDQAIVGVVTKTGQNSTWGLAIQNEDNTGLAPQSFASAGAEIDILSNGPDAVASAFNPALGNRWMMLLAAKVNPVTTYAAKTQFAAGTLIAETPKGGVPTVYIAQNAGTTGALAPTWPTSGIVEDGGIKWLTGVAYATEIGSGLTVSAGPKAAYNTAIAASGAVNNAAIDLTGVLLGKAYSAGIRLSHNMPVDFSGNGSAEGQNIRTLRYSDATTALTYTTKGTVALSIADTGLASFPGQIQAPLATPKSSSSPCVTGTRTADTNYEYVCVATNTWKRAALSPF